MRRGATPLRLPKRHPCASLGLAFVIAAGALQSRMPKVTRTYGPFHFEDLDPRRFEDLVRGLAGDFRDWQSIEATGRSGADDGIDIRAYEESAKQPDPDPDDGNEDGDPVPHPMSGNRWIFQCKREKELGPKRVLSIIGEIDDQDPPYGYVLAAPANFSKASYDTFRNELTKKGVLEFYMWGRPELEDMLLLPKNDRILFTFFGISLVSRRRSRSTEMRGKIVNKNKLLRILGEGGGRWPVLIRDVNDDHYPFKGSVSGFREESPLEAVRGSASSRAGTYCQAASLVCLHGY